MARTLFCLATGIVLIAAAAGCQGTGNVSGKVTYKDKPLVYGTVLIVASDGTIHQGSIREDGTYTVQGIQVGEARVAVNSPDPTTPLMRRAEPQGAELEEDRRRKSLKPKWFAIPADYGDPNKSGLKLQVRGGANAHDIDLK